MSGVRVSHHPPSTTLHIVTTVKPNKTWVSISHMPRTAPTTAPTNGMKDGNALNSIRAEWLRVLGLRFYITKHIRI